MTSRRTRWWAGYAASVGVAYGLLCSLSLPSRAAPTASFVPPPTVTHAAYVPPPAIRIYRFYVYAKLKQRTRTRATIESFVSTSERPVVEDDRAVIEREVVHAKTTEWAAVASATVKKILPKGRLEVEFDPTPGGAKRTTIAPLAAGQKIRLRIDRETQSQ